MNKSQLLTTLEESREQFLEMLEELSTEDMLIQGVTGDWSVKDILVHLARWEAEMVRLLWQVNQGQQPTTAHFNPAGVDDTNARWQAESKSRSLEQALEDFHGVRNQTIHRLESFSDGDLQDKARYKFLNGRPLWEWVAGDSFEHESEHAVEIKAWRAGLPST
jgi:hypothetical protein